MSEALVLNPEFFSAERLKKSKRQTSIKGGISYPTVLKYLTGDTGEEMDQYNGRVLYSLLTQGFGYSPEAVKELKIGEVFQLKTSNNE